MNKLGIIAAKGSLSNNLIDYAQNKFSIFIVAINGETSPELVKGIDHVWINIGEIGKAIKAMQAANVKELVFVGSLKKPDLLSLKVDSLGAKLIAKIAKDKFFGDNQILSSITNFLENQGFKVLGVHEILKNLVVKAGVYTTLQPNDSDKIDIELAIKIAKEIGKLDIGQGAIVQNGVVLGVEALEGTDNLIKRCANLKNSKNYGGVLVKCSKPNQELRMDLPTIGIETLKNMHLSGFKGIVIEAEKTIFLDQKEAIVFANKNHMYIQAL